jgi:hypothetical protein
LGAIDVSIVIDAPVTRVWNFVEPIERHVDWMVDARSIEFTSPQTRGVGTRFDCITKIGPIRLTDRMEITEWLPPTTMGVRHVGLVTGNGRFSLAETASGATLFSWHEDLDFPVWLVGGPLLLKRVWKRNLRAMKHLVESSP